MPPTIICRDCGSPLRKTKVAKHGGCLQLIGIALLAVAAVTLFLVVGGAVGVANTPTPTHGTPEAIEAAQNAKGAAVVAGGVVSAGAFFVAAPALIIGLLLCGSRKVWKCSGCGLLRDRG